MASIFSRSILQILAIAILARLITPKEFGYVAIAMMVLGFGEMIVEIGFAPAIIQTKNLTKGIISFCFYASITMGLIFVTANWFASPFIADFFEANETVLVIKVLGFNILITKIGLVSRALLEREMRFDLIAIADIFAIFVGYTIAIYLAFNGFGVWSLVVNSVVYSVISIIILIYLKPFSIKPDFTKADTKNVLTYGGGLTLSRLFNNIALRGDQFIVGKFLGTYALGIYEKTFHLMSMPGTYLGNIVDKVLFPGMSQIQDEKKRLAKAYVNALEFVNVMLIPVSVFMIVTAEQIVLVLLGNQWKEAIFPLQILLIPLALRTSVRSSDCLVRATGFVYGSALRKMVYALFVVVGSYIGSKLWGLAGVAVFINISVVANYLLMVLFGIKIVEGKISDIFTSLKNGLILGSFVFLASFLSFQGLKMIFENNFLILLFEVLLIGVFTVAIVTKFPAILGRTGHELFIRGIKKFRELKWTNN
ncbi:MAG: lipopolysaccharide biosynthesis protein [bacterium]